jgi:mannose-6-phosphate isomerase-like protein (cupin superfamily)
MGNQPIEPMRPDAILRQPPAWTAGDVSFWMLGTLGPNSLWLGRFGQDSIGQRSPWERHTEGEELLHVLEGAVDVTLLLDSEPVITRLDAGSIFLVPSGVWHRTPHGLQQLSSGRHPARASTRRHPIPVSCGKGSA